MNAQPVYFQKVFGDSLTQSTGKSVVQAADGSIYFTGNFNNFSTSTQGIELIKMDSAGNILWQEKLITGFAYTNRSIITSDKKILMNGQLTDSTGNTDALAVETDTAGNIIFSKTYGSTSTTEALQALLQTVDGGFIFSGFTTNPSGPGNAFWVVKTDSAGNEEWQQTYSYNVNSTCDDIVQTTDGGYLITGDKKTITANYNAHVIKIDSLGSIQWETDLTYPYNSGCKNLMINSEGNYIVIGEAATATSSYFDPFITKLDTAGNILWSHIIPCSNNGDAGYDIIEPTPGNYLITGFGYNTATLTADLLVMRLDSAGNEVSRRYYGSTGYDQGYIIISDYNNSGFLAAGFISDATGGKYFLIHDDLLGIPSAVNEISSGNTFTFYPSPADDILHLRTNGFIQNSLLKIYSLTGNIVLQKQLNSFNTIINTATLTSGLYVVEIRDKFHLEKIKLLILH